MINSLHAGQGTDFMICHDMNMKLVVGECRVLASTQLAGCLAQTDRLEGISRARTCSASWWRIVQYQRQPTGGSAATLTEVKTLDMHRAILPGKPKTPPHISQTGVSLAASSATGISMHTGRSQSTGSSTEISMHTGQSTGFATGISMHTSQSQSTGSPSLSQY